VVQVAPGRIELEGRLRQPADAKFIRRLGGFRALEMLCVSR